MKKNSLPETQIIYHMNGMEGCMAEKLTSQWLLPILESNPAMLRMLEDHEKGPHRLLLPWSGEFVGKHLTSACEVYLLTRDGRLEEHISGLVQALAEIQAQNGYIGPWSREFQLTGHTPNSHWEVDFMKRKEPPVPNWDTWDFYHMMTGLIYWYEIKRDKSALSCAVRLADLLYHTFWEKGVKLSSIGTTETNLAPVHSLALLYEITEDNRYLQMAEDIVEQFQEENAADYLNLAVAGKDFYEMPIPRWEGLHPVMGLAVLHGITGKQVYREAFENIWWSIARTDRHNTGGFSSGESACGNPYDTRPIETCCTVAWMALTVEMLKMGGSSRAADELELSFLNGGLGSLSPSGRWCTYNTPMEGFRWSSMKDIAFQSRPGSPELNCCSVNAPRILGMLSQWAVVRGEGRLDINYFGAYDACADLQGQHISVHQEGDYLKEGHIRLKISQERKAAYTLRLRIPGWSEKTKVLVNGCKEDAHAGTYLELNREWGRETEIEMWFDMSLRFWAGEKEMEGKSSVYRGPLLLAYDTAYNRPGEEPCFDAGKMKEKPVETAEGMPVLLTACRNTKGREVFLCDFRSAGFYGNGYRTWFPISNTEKKVFTKENPLRCCRP